MKKVISIILSVLLTLSIISLSGCKEDIFEGKYEEVSREKVIKVLEYFQRNEENLIDWASGASITMLEKTNDVEYNIECRIAFTQLLGERTGVLEYIEIAQINDKTEKTEVIFDGAFAYKKTEFAKNTQKVKGQVSFEDIVIDYIDIDDEEDVIGDALSLSLESSEKENVTIKYYLDNKGKELTKLRVEYVAYEDDVILNIKECFVYDKDYNMQAINIDTKMVGETDTINAAITIEKWDGEISVPFDTEDYTTVENI